MDCSWTMNEQNEKAECAHFNNGAFDNVFK